MRRSAHIQALSVFTVDIHGIAFSSGKYRDHQTDKGHYNQYNTDNFLHHFSFFSFFKPAQQVVLIFFLPVFLTGTCLYAAFRLSACACLLFPFFVFRFFILPKLRPFPALQVHVILISIQKATEWT